MSEPRTEQDRLLDEAIDLVIRYQNDPDNPVASEMIRSWCARGPEHEELWERVSSIHGAAGHLLTEKRRLERRENLGLTRRNLAIGGITLLGATAVSYSFGPGLVLQARADYKTSKGEVRPIRLSDGSVATLGPQSAITVDFHQDRRSIELLAGMCFFEVARDTSRPFSVRSGTLEGVALGTAFDISNDAGIHTLSVDHGLVDVRTDAMMQDRLHITDGEWFSIDPSSGSFERGRRESGQVASWRDNLIFAERETVSALVARIGRWVPGRVVLADPFVGGQRVSGVFDLNDPIRALEAVVHPAGAHVRRLSSLLTVISPV